DRFEVTAGGAWTIEILPLTAARVAEVPGSIEGMGDDVILLIGGTPDTATITNEGESNFAVWGYGDSRSLLVNEIGDYSGTVILDADTVILVITSEGSWSINITER